LPIRSVSGLQAVAPGAGKRAEREGNSVRGNHGDSGGKKFGSVPGKSGMSSFLSSGQDREPPDSGPSDLRRPSFAAE